VFEDDNRAEFGFAGWRANVVAWSGWHWESHPVGIEVLLLHTAQCGLFQWRLEVSVVLREGKVGLLQVAIHC